MAGKAAAPGTAVLLVTANVGSLFDDEPKHYTSLLETNRFPSDFVTANFI